MIVPFLDISAQNSELRPEIDKAIKEVLDSNQFIGGKTVENFENRIKEYLGVEYAVSCGNGTDALILALKACRIGPGDEVITTAFSFFATAEAICAVGAKPVFVDILEDSYLIDPDKIEDAITAKTKAIIPVHIFGACCDMDRILEIASNNSLRVIEDCAQAIGSEYKGEKAGVFGDIACFSFYPTKNLGGMGDGGMCVTNYEVMAKRLRALKEHGAGQIGLEASETFGGDKLLESLGEPSNGLYNPLKYYNYLIGCNSRLDAIQAAILNVKLDYVDRYNERRRKIADIYRRVIGNYVSHPEYQPDTVPVYHQYAILTGDRDGLVEYLNDKGIGTGNFYPVPLHKQKAFNSENCGNYGVTLPVVERVCKGVVCLPIYPELCDREIKLVADSIVDYFQSGGIKPRQKYIHPSAEVSELARIGDGTKIWNNAQVREKAVIGEDCNIGKNVYIDEGALVGNRVKIQNNVNVYRGVTVENDVFLGPNMTFTNDMYPRAFNENWTIVPTLVKRGASIGAGATICPGVVIGEYSMVGAGSVVTNDVPPHTLVVGCPAREIGTVCYCGKQMDGTECPDCGYSIGDADGIHV